MQGCSKLPSTCMHKSCRKLYVWLRSTDSSGRVSVSRVCFFCWNTQVHEGAVEIISLSWVGSSERCRFSFLLCLLKTVNHQSTPQCYTKDRVGDITHLCAGWENYFLSVKPTQSNTLMPGAWTCTMGKKTKQMNKKRRDIFNIRQISVGLISTSREILTARQDLYTIT